MKKVLCLAGVLFFMGLGQAFADYYTFSYVDGTFDASGWLQTAPGSGSVTVIGGSLGSAPLYTGGTAPSPGAYATSPSGAFWFDNALNTHSTPMLSGWGLLFTSGTFGSAGYSEINIWGNTGAHDYSYYTATGPGSFPIMFNAGTFTITQVSGPSAVPVPPAALLLGSGLVGLAMLRKRPKR